MLGHSASIIEPGSRGFLVWYRTQAIRWKIWFRYRPSLKRASSWAEKERIRLERENEVRKALESEDLLKPDPHSLC